MDKKYVVILEEIRGKRKLRMDTDDESWITMHGTHVKIGDDGEITAGPKEFVGKNVNNLGFGGVDVDTFCQKLDNAAKAVAQVHPDISCHCFVKGGI